MVADVHIEDYFNRYSASGSRMVTGRGSLERSSVVRLCSSLLFVYSLTTPYSSRNDAKSSKGGGARQFNGLVDVYKKTSRPMVSLVVPWFVRRVGIIVYRVLLRSLRLASGRFTPYQESCVEDCLVALKAGSTRIGVSLPTGSGKTTVLCTCCRRLHPSRIPDGEAIELALQAAAQAESLCPGLTVEIEQGTNNQASGFADITIATYQTLLQPQRLAKFDPNGLKAVIVDEAHHAAAPSYRRILSHFDSAVQTDKRLLVSPTITHPIPILGFSATFSRHDGLALGSVFQSIVYHRDFLDMIKEQWLCNVRFTSVRANIDLSQVTVNSRTGDFNPTSLAHVINTTTVNKLVVQSWLDRATTRKSTLVFCVNLAHVRELTATFREAGVDARYIYSATPAGERRTLIDSFKAGGYPVLVNCAILTEGADIPNIDCIIVARPTRSRNVFAQMIGRGMRQSPGTGKEDCHIIDFVDSTGRVSGVVSTPTLFGLDPSAPVQNETLESLEARAAAAATGIGATSSTTDVPDPESVTYIDYDDPFVLVDQASGAPHIRKLSSNAWVGCGEDVYVLECLGKGYIRVERVVEGEENGPQFEGHYTPATLPMGTAFTLKISPYRRSIRILRAQTLVEAIRGCDTYATSKVVQGHMATALLRTARWRKEPATDGQKTFVKKRWKKRSEMPSTDSDSDKKPTTVEERLDRMTKGEAANIIIRLKHGAQTRYEKKAKAVQKVRASLAKEQMRKAREHVKVGPLTQVD
ncbi:P-loop containing nucleoside triphosphate hydrolase protein [Amylocystis lapponica]|nr:P-loop containing nucleoside triphosphate hydrolase protein [Amylocystis lapponica]